MNYYINNNGTLCEIPDEYLMHYGVKGMKWGQRKAKYETERLAYKQAKKTYRDARREVARSGNAAFGRTRLKRLVGAEKARDKAEIDMIAAKAKYKAAKAKTAEKAEKAEAKVYRKEMSKSGLVGSGADRASNNRSTRLYNHMKATKGKKYADAVEKKVQNVAVAKLATGVAVTVGATVVRAMLEKQY